MSSGRNDEEETIDTRMQAAENRPNSISTSTDNLNDDINEMKNTLGQIKLALNLVPLQSPPVNQQGLASQVAPVVAPQVAVRSEGSAVGSQLIGISRKLAHRIYLSTMDNTKLSTVPDFKFNTARSV